MHQKRSEMRSFVSFLLFILLIDITLSSSERVNIMNIFTTSLRVEQRLINFCFKQGCQFKNVILRETSFHAYSCWKCYESLQTSNKLVKVNCPLNGDSVPALETNGNNNKSCEIFFYRSQFIKEQVQRSLSNSLRYDMWRKCCEDAIDCCDTLTKEYQVENFGSCEGFWDEDERTCYHQTEPGAKVFRTCPHMKSLAYYSRCECELVAQSCKNLKKI